MKRNDIKRVMRSMRREYLGVWYPFNDADIDRTIALIETIDKAINDPGAPMERSFRGESWLRYSPDYTSVSEEVE